MFNPFHFFSRQQNAQQNPQQQNPQQQNPVQNQGQPGQPVKDYRQTRATLMFVSKAIQLGYFITVYFVEQTQAATGCKKEDKFDDSLFEQPGFWLAGISSLAFLLEQGIYYYDKKIDRNELQDAKNAYNAANNKFPNIATAQASDVWHKTYGYDRVWITHVFNFFNSLANMGFNACSMAITSNALDKSNSPYMLAASLATSSLQWLHQVWIEHNLKHEKKLYEDAKGYILDKIVTAQPNPIQPAAQQINAPQVPAQPKIFKR